MMLNRIKIHTPHHYQHSNWTWSVTIQIFLTRLWNIMKQAICIYLWYQCSRASKEKNHSNCSSLAKRNTKVCVARNIWNDQSILLRELFDSIVNGDIPGRRQRCGNLRQHCWKVSGRSLDWRHCCIIAAILQHHCFGPVNCMFFS